MLIVLDAQIALMQSLEKAGAKAIGVHMRRTDERPKDKAHWEALAPLVKCVSVPVIANGDIYTREDIAEIRRLSGCSSVMLARGAMKNPCAFGEFK